MSNQRESAQQDLGSGSSAVQCSAGLAGQANPIATVSDAFARAQNHHASFLGNSRPPVPLNELLNSGTGKNLMVQGRDLGMTRKSKDKMEVPICGRLSADRFRVLENWCDFSFRKRSEVVGMVLERVLEILELQPSSEMPVEQFVRRLHVDPP